MGSPIFYRGGVAVANEVADGSEFGRRFSRFSPRATAGR